MNFFSLGAKDIGIDLGTSNTLVTLKEKGIIINEPSVVALDRITNNIVAVGHKAKEMLGKTPEQIRAIKPIKDGAIADFTATQIMISDILKKITKRYGIGRQRVVVGVPCNITEVEERAIQEAIIAAGAKEVFLIEDPLAAAIGEGLNIADPTGNMILDIGGGITEIAVISLGGIVISDFIKTAGEEIDNAIINYIKFSQDLAIGQITAEEVKKELGCAKSLIEEKTMEIRGRNLINGLPENRIISSKEVEKAMKPSIDRIVELVRTTIEKTPPELVSDIVSTGLTITGGGALIKNLDMVIQERIDIPVFVSKAPLECVALGTEKVSSNLDKYGKTLSKKRIKKM